MYDRPNYYRLASRCGVLMMFITGGITAVQGEWLGVVLISGYAVVTAAYLLLGKRLPAAICLVLVIAFLFNTAGYVWEILSQSRSPDVASFSSMTCGSSLDTWTCLWQYPFPLRAE